MNKNHLRELITKVLYETGLYSDSAVELLMLTAAMESRLGYYLYQIRGPARGIFQMEPATEEDIHKNYLTYKEDLEDVVDMYSTYKDDELEWNLAYQIIMARIHYLRVKEPLPDKDDIEGLARYWKSYYNTAKGKGNPDKAMNMYRTYAL